MAAAVLFFSTIAAAQHEHQTEPSDVHAAHAAAGVAAREVSGTAWSADITPMHAFHLFMDAAAAYDRPLSGSVRWQIYGGAAGEPALGPPGFPHRSSALSNPIAPIGHHWLDSTHITYGLVTAGVYTQRWKAEASVFNGREPDPTRTDFDFVPLDSVAGRVSIAPAGRWALQVSAGHLRDAEVGQWKGLMTTAGATASISILPPRLAPTYGGHVVPGFGVFAAWRPALTQGS